MDSVGERKPLALICTPGSNPVTQSTAAGDALPRPNRFKGTQSGYKPDTTVTLQAGFPVAGSVTASAAR